MMEILNKLIEYFAYPFVRYAMIVGVLISLCSSLLGVTLVLKRFSFIGDGLSHVAFGAMAIAAALSLSNSFLLILPVTIACAILLLRMGQNTKIKGDAALAMLSVGALGIGYLIMNMFSKSSNLSGDVCATLFGSTSILTLKSHFGSTNPNKGGLIGSIISGNADVELCSILAVLVVLVFVLFYHKIFAVTFDEDFSMATGVRAKLYNLMFAVVIAVVIVLAMRLVGALLVSALVIFPALSAMRVFKSFKSVTVCAVVLSVTCTALGILISIISGTPVGSMIVAVDIVGFCIFSAIGSLARHGAIKA